MRRLALLGIVVVAVGFVTLLDRGLAGFFQLDYLFVSAVSALAIVGGARYVYGARSNPRRTVDVESPEPRYRSAVLGEDVEPALRATGQEGTTRRAELRRRLQALAVDALVTHAGYDREAAAAAIEDGTWTDDDVAAGYLATPVSLPRRMRVRNVLQRRATARTCVIRSLDAIEEVQSP